MCADDSTMHISGKICQLYKLKSKKTWIELNYGTRIDWFDFQFIFESILIPSNFSQAECWNCLKLIVKDSYSFWNASFCFVPTVIHFVLLQYISILLSLHHNSILFKSSEIFKSWIKATFLFRLYFALNDYGCVVWGNCSNDGDLSQFWYQVFFHQLNVEIA
jgi:hypothetical protein